MKKVDKELMKLTNKKSIIKCFMTKKVLSKTDIMEETALSSAALSYLIPELEEEEWIIEVGVGAFSGGRRPVMYSLNAQKGYMLSVQVSTKGILIGLIDLGCQLIEAKTVIGLMNDEESFIKIIEEGIGILKKNYKALFEKIIAVNISIPGVIDERSGLVIHSAHFRLYNFDMKALFNRLLGKKVEVFTFKDTDALLLGEYYFIHESTPNMAYILCDRGVGLSLLILGELFRTLQVGLELGHMTIDPNGPVCHCGRRGCIGAMVSELPAIKHYVELREQHDMYIEDLGTLSFGDIIKQYSHDECAKEVIDKQVDLLSEVIANMINLFNIKKVIIGGPLTLLGETLESRLENAVRRKVLVCFREGIQIRRSELDMHAAILGMAKDVLLHQIGDLKHL